MTSPPQKMVSATFKTGDFDLVSSDNITFQIDSFHLFAASGTVFRNGRLTSKSTPQVIELTDDNIETSAVLHDFLVLITRGTFDKMFQFSVDDPTQVSKLLAFLIKYDCNVWIDFALRVMEAGRFQPITLFVLGSKTDRVESCTVALKKEYHRVQDNQLYGDDFPSALNPRIMPFGVFDGIPSVPLGVTKAWDTQPLTADGLITEFTKHLDIAKGKEPKSAFPFKGNAKRRK